MCSGLWLLRIYGLQDRREDHLQQTMWDWLVGRTEGTMSHIRRTLPVGWRFVFVVLVLAGLTRALLLAGGIVELLGPQDDKTHFAIVTSGHLAFLLIAAFFAWSIVDDRRRASKVGIASFVVFSTTFDVMTWIYAGTSAFGVIEVSVITLGLVTVAVLLVISQLPTSSDNL
jgi:hypothetical protein